MASICSAVMAIALAASEPSSAKVERRAGILSGIGVGFAIGGGFAIGVGAVEGEPRITVGGAALIGLGLHAIALAVVAWLWPDDRWLGLLTDEARTVARRPPAQAPPRGAAWQPQR